MMSHFSLAAFKIVSLSLSFNILIIMYISVSIFEFILFGVFELLGFVDAFIAISIL